MLPLANLDHVLLGVIAAGLGVYFVWQASSCRHADAPGWLRLALAVSLTAVALDIQIAVLGLLLGPNGSQDGILLGDLRLRNALGALLLLGVWGAAVVAWRRRRATSWCQRL